MPTYEIYPTGNANSRAATAYVTDRSSADSVGLDAAVNSKIDTEEATSIFVQCRMSTAAATVALTVVLYNASGDVIGIAAPGTQTATATSYRDTASTGDYWTQILLFDAGAAAQYEVRMAAPSAGSVDIYTWKA